GNVNITGSGGANIGPINLLLPAPPAFDFNGRTGLNSILRSDPLPISWSAVSGTVVILGVNFDHPANASGLFLCAAPATSAGFTVPPYILQTIPVSRAGYAQSNGYIMTGLIPASAPITFTAPSLDSGYVISVSWAVKSVVFR
ncbi:MAG: hypothetical protein ABI995_03125, partial [Acidobacteriota bacterium]